MSASRPVPIRFARGAWIAAALAALVLAPARAEGPRPALFVEATLEVGHLNCTVETSLPEGTRLDVRLQRRGRTIAAARARVRDKRAELGIPVPGTLPPTYYDIVVLGTQPGGAPLRTTVSVAFGSREQILTHRGAERRFYEGLGRELDRLFRFFLADVQRAARDGSDPALPAFRESVASSLALVSSFRNDLAAREVDGAVPLLPEVHLLAVGLADHLIALHQEFAPTGSRRDPPVVFEDAFPATAERGFAARIANLDLALARERALGDVDLLVHTLRTLERLRETLGLIRSHATLKAAELNWRQKLVPFEDDLATAGDHARTLAATASDTAHPESFAALGRLVAAVREAWQELGRRVTGRSPSWKAYDDLERVVREEFARVVDPLALDYVRVDR